jgi:VanZ family protein
MRMRVTTERLRSVIYWLPVLLYAGLIFSLSALPHPEDLVPSIFKLLGDKVLHAIEYGVLGILFYRAFRHAAGNWGRQYALALAILAASLYGLSDEIHQAFTPNRVSSGWDLLADVIGATLAGAGWHWNTKR